MDAYTCSSCGHGDGMHSGSCYLEDSREATNKICEWASKLESLYNGGTQYDFDIWELKKIIDEMNRY